MIKKLAVTGVLGFAVAASALAAAPAQAAAFGGYGGDGSHNTTAGNIGILNGNQVIVPISAAVDVCGNAVGVIGIVSAQCKGGAVVYD